MNKYFSYEYDEDFDYNENYDPSDYPMPKTLDYMDYCYTYHYDGSARVNERGDD